MTGTDETKYLFVASTGGHLAQLERLSSLMPHADDSVWVTFRSPQSESLLAGRRVVWVDYVRSRDLIGVLRASREIRRLLTREHFDVAVSTGAAVAVAALPLARLRGIRTIYIESVSRVEGPSLTGRILWATRSAELHTQHAGWAGGRWRAHPSVFGTFAVSTHSLTPRPRLFVTLGTIEGYRFDALIDAVLSTGLADESTLWQLGSTMREDLPGTVVAHLDATEFRARAQQADVVVSHAGVGTILDLLDASTVPVVVPRRRHRREHVDDHQRQIAALVDRLGVAVVSEAEDLSPEHLLRASGLRVTPEGTR